MSLQPKKVEPPKDFNFARRRAHEEIDISKGNLQRAIARHCKDHNIAQQATTAIEQIVQQVEAVI